MSNITFKKIAQYLVYILFITPLLAFPAFFTFPFVVPKVIFFRSISLLIFVVVLLIWLAEKKNQEYKQKLFTPLTLVLLIFFFSLAVSTVFALDWRFALWSGQERMLGSFTIFHYLLLFFSLRFLFTNWSEWKKALVVFSVVGALVVLVGIIQKIKPDFFYNSGSTQPISTLGNPIYLAGLGLYLFFVNLFIGIKEKDWHRWMFWILSVFGLIGIYIAGTRGTFLGLVTGMLLAVVMSLFIFKNSRRLKITALGLAIVVVLIGGLGFTFRKTNFVRSIPLLGRVVNISPFEGTAQTRLMAWQVALKGWTARPIFGWGTNNYYFVFNKFYNPDFLKFDFQETWFDSAHNVVMNTLATQGLLGAVAYLLIFVSGGYCLIKIYRHDHSNAYLLILGTAFLLGHFIHNFFAFEDITSYLYFFLFLAFIEANYRASARGENFYASNIEKTQKNKVSIPLAVIFIALGGILIYVSNVNVALANNDGYNARGLLVYSHKVNSAIAKYQAAENIFAPHKAEIGWDFSSDILSVLPDVYEQSTTTARTLYDIADKAMDGYIQIHPADVRSRLVYTDILRAGIVLFDLPLKQKVDEQFKVARELSPGRQQIDYSELSFEAGTGDIKDAISKMRALVKQYPYSPEGYYNLGRFLLYDKQYLEILPVLDEAINNGVRFTDPVHLEFVAMAYEREGRFYDALYWWNEMYKVTGSASVKHKRDELSSLTQKPVPQNLEDFFKFSK